MRCMRKMERVRTVSFGPSLCCEALLAYVAHRSWILSGLLYMTYAMSMAKMPAVSFSTITGSTYDPSNDMVHARCSTKVKAAATAKAGSNTTRGSRNTQGQAKHDEGLDRYTENVEYLYADLRDLEKSHGEEGREDHERHDTHDKGRSQQARYDPLHPNASLPRNRSDHLSISLGIRSN